MLVIQICERVAGPILVLGYTFEGLLFTGGADQGKTARALLTRKVCNSALDDELETVESEPRLGRPLFHHLQNSRIIYFIR